MIETKDAKGNYPFRLRPYRPANCGHAHADALSLSGRNGGPDRRSRHLHIIRREVCARWFRSSAAHNTLTVDGRSSSVGSGPFSWKSIASSKRLAWLSQDRFDYVAGAHDGYVTMPQPATHDRSILFLKHDYWIIRDRLESAGERKVDLWFHFDPASDPLIEAAAEQDAFIAENTGESGLDVRAFAENARWKREDGWVSHCYAQKDAARVTCVGIAARHSEHRHRCPCTAQPVAGD